MIGITGGLGLVGKALRRNLEAPIVFLSRKAPEESLNSNEECIIGNFADPAIADLFTDKIDVLIHAASGVGPRSNFENQFIEDDLVGTLNLAKMFFKKNPRGHFIYLSTAGGLYDLEDLSVKTELSEVTPKSLYGAIKLLVEDFLEKLSIKEGRVTILRPSAVYGDSFKKNQTIGLIDKLLKSTLESSVNNVVPIFDNMESARDYLHVDDLVKAIVILINQNTKSSFELYNLGTGIETSINDVINSINLFGKVKVDIQSTTNQKTSLIVNSDKIFSDIGWKAEISLKQGMSKMHQDLKNKELI